MEKETQLFHKHMEDLARRSDRDFCMLSSEFLNDAERLQLSALTGRQGGERGFGLPVSVFTFGGYEDAERVVAVFKPDGYPEIPREELAEQIGLTLLDVRVSGGDYLKHKLGHRDYLGALMGLGITRESIGDILVREDGALIFVKSEVAAYIERELSSVGAAVCSVSETSAAETNFVSDKTEAMISVSSLRLDAIVARAFNLSRGTACEAISGGRVFVNGEPCDKPDRSIRIGDSVTLRGKGKLRLKEEAGKSKSDKFRIRVDLFGQR